MRVRSITATRLRSLAAQMAPFCPAGPLPITIRSNSWLLMKREYSSAIRVRAQRQECLPLRSKQRAGEPRLFEPAGKALLRTNLLLILYRSVNAKSESRLADR